MFGKYLRCIFKGVLLLRGFYILGFLVAALISTIVFCNKDFYNQAIGTLDAPGWVNMLGFAVLLLLPTWYLLILGYIQEMKQEQCRKQFEAIGFKSRDGKYPYLVKKIKDKNPKQKTKKYKEVFIFKSNIALSEWMGAKERIETAIDRNIIRFSEGQNKKICRITAVPPECKIPMLLNWSDSKLDKRNGVVVVGEGAIETIEFDLNRTPHVLVAGETGSGKSVILRTLLWQLICMAAKVYMIDFKGGVEFGKRYETYGEVITERERAVIVLKELCDENAKRLALFREMEVKNLPEYNRKTGKNLCRIGVFCDEIAEMLDKKGASKEDKEIMEKLEGLISSLARLSRATGINLFLGVQRPDANVLTGQIKNNIPVRICGRFADKSASEIVLGNTDAVFLPEIKGRVLFRLGNITETFQAYYFDDDIHLHGEAPKTGQMLLHMEEARKDEIVSELRTEDCITEAEGRAAHDTEVQEEQEEAKTSLFAQIQEKQEEKKLENYGKRMAKLEKKAAKGAADQEAFDFTWSCEGKEQDV